MPTFLTYIMILLIVVDFVIEQILDKKNHQRWKLLIPNELKDLYDEGEYRKAIQYHEEKKKVSQISTYLQTTLTILLLFFCLLGLIQNWITTLTNNPFWQAFIFFGIYGSISFLIGLPFSTYNTFVIEEKYGFNKTTPKTFVLDIIKSTLVSILLGGALLSAVIAFYLWQPVHFWIYSWLLFAIFSIFMAMFYTKWLVPLFNKLTPLEDGKLKQQLKILGEKTGFPLHQVYVIDGSKRSTKANAYFSGFGPKKTIVLYDTLIEQLTTEEVVAVMAHEIGHYKHKHVYGSLILSLLQIGFMLWILSLCIHLPAIHEALGAAAPSFHIGIIAFSLLYSPIGMITSLGMNALTRKNEYQADDYAKKWSNAEDLINGLKKLHKDSLSNINPHPAYVFVHYSHPTLLQRIQALRK